MSKFFLFHLETPGIVFTHPDGKNVRTPIKFKVKSEDVPIYKSVLKTRGIYKYSIYPLEGEVVEEKNNKINPRAARRIRPVSAINLGFRIQG